jgi:hypothetical protein
MRIFSSVVEVYHPRRGRPWPPEFLGLHRGFLKSPKELYHEVLEEHGATRKEVPWPLLRQVLENISS